MGLGDGTAQACRRNSGEQQTAIAWTTAGSVVAIVEMVRAGKLTNHGFLKQEDIALDDFLASNTGHFYL